jgi:putative endonuclease
MNMTISERVIDFWHQLRSQWSSDPLERCRWIRFPSTRQSRSTGEKDQLARAGEDAAAHYLTSKGFSVLHRNIRFPEGELDFVAAAEKTLVFIEVKTRKAAQFGKPYHSVSEQKQRRLIAMASRFVSLCRLQDVPVRFGVVSIVFAPNQPPQIEHLENAFLVQDLDWR